MDNMEASTWISLIALGISLWVARKEEKRENRINSTNLQAIYFNEIFLKVLIDELPNARRTLHFDEESRLADITPLVDTLNVIRKKSLYFKYTDENFYRLVEQATQDFEDYLVNNEGKTFRGEEETEVLNEIKTKMEKVYQTIMSHYSQT